MVKGHMFSVVLFSNKAGETFTDPGTSYVEWTTGGKTTLRTTIDFTQLKPKFVKVLVVAEGNESGSGKGIEIYDPANSQSIVAVTWGGTALQCPAGSGWGSFTSELSRLLTVRVKGSSATEDITIYRVELQIIYD